MTLPSTSLVGHLASWPDTPEAHRRPASWVADPVLRRLKHPAEAAAVAAQDEMVFAALAARPSDPVATMTALAVVATHLLPVVRRWSRSGLTGHDQADAEADLIAAALDALRSRPDLPAGRVAQTAWHRWHTARRTERSRWQRLVPLQDHHPQPAATPVDPFPPVLADAVASGRISRSMAAPLWADLCGWSSREAAELAGCSVEAWWARRYRARRTMRAALNNNKAA